MYIGSGSSSSSSLNPSGITLDELSDLPTRKRNRSIIVSEKYKQLVEYEVAPAEFQSSISSASESMMSHETEAGRRTAVFKIKRVARSNVRPSDIGIAAVKEPDEDDLRDMDFFASSNIVFFEFLGSPGILSSAKCLEFLCNRVDGMDWAQRRRKIESPTHSLVAAGDFATIAARMRLEKPAPDGA
jgi:hypothetical protein